MLQQAIRDETELIQSSAVTFTGHVWEGMWQNTSKHARSASLPKGVKHCRFHSSLCLSQANRGKAFLLVLSCVFQHLRGETTPFSHLLIAWQSKHTLFQPRVPSMQVELLTFTVRTSFVCMPGLRQYILSDRDPRFTPDLYKAIFEKLGVHLSFSTSNHPQTDGQTERTHRTIEQILRTAVIHRRTNWENLLPASEFAFNDMVQASSCETPFFLNCRHYPSRFLI